MGRLDTTGSPVAHTLRAIAWLLEYPDEDMRRHLAHARAALHDEAALGTGRLAEIDALIDTLRQGEGLRAESAYVECFDRGRATSLHLFEHVHGDSRDRGPAMIELVRTYEAAGLCLRPGELPDYLPVLLQYASTQPPAQARAFVGEFAHILRSLLGALARRHDAYACLPAALLDLAGEAAVPADAPADPPIDQSWEEPAAFDGCNARPGADAPQPVRLMRRAAPAAAGAARPALPENRP